MFFLPVQDLMWARKSPVVDQGVVVKEQTASDVEYNYYSFLPDVNGTAPGY